MMKLDLTPSFFIFIMLLFCNSNTVHKFLNFCLEELLSALDTAGSNISKKYKNHSAIQHRKDSYVVVTIMLAETKMPTETIKLQSKLVTLFYCAYKNVVLNFFLVLLFF